jgi:hypothetical protein
MAKKKTASASSSTFKSTATFDKAMVTDVNDYHLPENAWTYARNAINNSRKGDIGKLSNEPGNQFCTTAPFNIIGSIHIEKDIWAVFSTNNYLSEIGLFVEGECSYTKLVRSTCLRFKTTNLIIGVAKPNAFCSHELFWDDGINPTRYIDINKIPWLETCEDVDGCKICEPTLDSNDEKILDCEQLRLESIYKTPTAVVKKGVGIGTLNNGTYHVHTAYYVNEQRVTDYTTMSNTISLFTHDNVNGSIDVDIKNLDTNIFDDYELVLVYTVAEKTVARHIGMYSTGVTKVSIDNINLESGVIDSKLLGYITPVPDKSKGVYSTGKYLLRVSPTDKFQFNYQPLANQIRTFWQSVEYPKDYYKNGGINVGHMRDEVYTYFIRWIYNTGDKTPSFHIPGRGPVDYVLTNDDGSKGSTLKENDPLPSSFEKNVIEDYVPKVFEVFNTAYFTKSPNTLLDDGGVVIHEGRMGYYESLELYPDNNPQVWNASSHLWSDSGDDNHDLCGKPIRHHKFPENSLNYSGLYSDITNHYNKTGDKIRVMGVRFENIKPPKDNKGKVIKNIVGYEILRGSRDGNRSVLYKGLINNMFEYDLPSKITSRKGLYANYPFNDLRPDPFISKKKTNYDTAGGLKNLVPNAAYSKKHFTFNSPDVSFGRPFLNANELKIYGIAHGISSGKYAEASDHPKHKFYTDLALGVALIAGVGYAMAKQFGKKVNTYTGWQKNATALPWNVTGTTMVFTGGTAIGYLPNPKPAAAAAAILAADTVKNNALKGLGILDIFTGTNTKELAQKAYIKSTASAAVMGSMYSSASKNEGFDNVDQTPTPLRMMQAIPMFLTNMQDGANSTLELIKAVSPYNQFAHQFISKCEYEEYQAPSANNRRRKIDDSRYTTSQMQDFQSTHIINNLYRPTGVVFNTFKNVENTAIADVSRPDRLSQMADNDKFEFQRRRAASHYVAFKNPDRRQYGQLDSIKMIPTKSEYVEIDLTQKTSKSPVIFGGDTYIGKYSEKNTLFYFTNWLESVMLDGGILDYTKYMMFDYSSFWMNTSEFNINEFYKSIGDGLVAAMKTLKFATFFKTIKSPSDFHCFDRNGGTGWMMLKNAYMYLFNSGVRNFFVESELNVDCRDYEDEDAKKHYPIESNLSNLFNMRTIKADNFYKLDRSLCESFLPHSKTSWSTLLDTKYDPALSETCYTTRENRLIYSLPQETLNKKNNWSVFLPNNKKDFTSKITAIKPVDKTGAMLFFQNESPALLPGVDELQTGNGIKLIVGDGGLFSRELQRLSHTERSIEYGSCQDGLSAINTPSGIFWINANQGKIFNYAGGLKEISLKNNRFWLSKHLPFQILESFPNFDGVNNPLTGIGCQSVYDNEYMLVYFSKKDYKLKDEHKDKPHSYVGNGLFIVDGYSTFIDNPLYFDECSFTLSYDVKSSEFISYHDWFPDLTFSSKNNFLTTKGATIWRHNKTCQKYCNYYGIDYPFEVEFQLDTKFAVSTIRNIEYYLESYTYADNCYDRLHLLDHNFDEAVVYNSEQCSGVLRMRVAPKNNITELLLYPKVSYSFIEILFSKEEQQYRFNQFWDITRNRGEFQDTNEVMWNTEANGYIRELNTKYLNYKKNAFQLKKFRHYNSRVLLKRNVCNNVEMLVNVAFANQHLSPR